jgi:hypothetical protein
MGRMKQNISLVPVRRRRSAAQITQLMAQYTGSGLTQREFARTARCGLFDIHLLAATGAPDACRSGQTVGGSRCGQSGLARLVRALSSGVQLGHG